MNTDLKTAYKRINITLPKETVRLLNKTTEKGQRSSLVDEALKFYINRISRINIQKLLKERALRKAKQDLSLAEEWFNVDEETWQKNKI